MSGMDNFKACLNLLLRVSKYWGKAKSSIIVGMLVVRNIATHWAPLRIEIPDGMRQRLKLTNWSSEEWIPQARDVSARTPIPSIKLFLKIFLTRFGLLVRASFAASTRLERPESLPKEHLGLVQHKSVLYSTEDEQLSGDGLRGNWGSNGQENN
uniref:Uncharacterized protein n=1 Tax=Coccidioides posadasii RMSCC 3488 TaxID=454284 RepID=A0A0J6FJ11_COCPO|nr:hypothetical protein CPAG_05148 [Coccidioides posadasii RMSCC 3488]